MPLLDSVLEEICADIVSRLPYKAALALKQTNRLFARLVDVPTLYVYTQGIQIFKFIPSGAVDCFMGTTSTACKGCPTTGTAMRELQTFPQLAYHKPSCSLSTFSPDQTSIATLDKMSWQIYTTRISKHS